jgi:transposase InsO family protein
MIDEFTRECLAIRVARRLNSYHVIETLGDCMLAHGVPEHVRSDNGAEMTARRVKQWLQTVGTQPLFMEPGSPWENGYCESFNGKLRDECLNGEIFYSLKEAQVVIEMWRKHYNTIRPHSAWVIVHRRRSAGSPPPRSTVFLRLRNPRYGRTAYGVQALTMNSLRSAWTPSSPARRNLRRRRSGGLKIGSNL